MTTPVLRHIGKTEKIQEQIRNWIQQQGLKPGDQIMPQNALAQIFKVAPPTMCKALAGLAREGVLRRVKGKGTFLTSAAGTRDELKVCLIMSQPDMDKPKSSPGAWHIFHSIMQGLTEIITGIGALTVLVIPYDRDPAQVTKELMAYDAVFFHTTGDAGQYRDLIVQLTALAKPVVVIVAARIGKTPGWDKCLNVFYQRQESVRQGIHYLAKCGYRRIGYIGSDINIYKEKINGYRQALADYGLGYDPKRVVSGINGQDEGERGASILLTQAADVDAVFVDTDFKAMGVIRYFTHRGIRVPDDIGVMGHDGVEALLGLSPRLTTVRVPYREIIAAAVRELTAGDLSQCKGKSIGMVADIVAGETTQWAAEREIVRNKESEVAKTALSSSR